MSQPKFESSEFDDLSYTQLLKLKYLFDLGDAGVEADDLPFQSGIEAAEIRAHNAGRDCRSERVQDEITVSIGFGSDYRECLEGQLKKSRAVELESSPKNEAPTDLMKYRFSTSCNLVISYLGTAGDPETVKEDAAAIANEMLDDLNGMSPRGPFPAHSDPRLYPVSESGRFEGENFTVENAERVEEKQKN